MASRPANLCYGAAMNEQIPKPSSPQPDRARQRIEEIRNTLLTLHKALVESERVSYEKTVGKIKSANAFLKLLIDDPWFAWLHPLSQLIVSIDEAVADKEPLTTSKADALARECNRLLSPAENGKGFGGHYWVALQRDPDVVLAHAAAIKQIGLRKRGN